MSLPDVQFQNNIGSIFFKHCLIGVTDGWEMNGRVIKHVKSISIDGHILRGKSAEGIEGLITSTSTQGKRYGSDGTLTLPWTVLSNVRMTDMSIPVSNYIDWVPVQAVFADDFPDSNLYTMSFFGFTLYNPRLSVPLPNRGLRDDYPHMPWSDLGFLPNDPRNGVFRNRAGAKNMDISLTGTMRIDDAKFPPALLSTLTQRNGLTINNGTILQIQNFTLPAGVPRTFNLGDAIPEITKDMNLAHVFVTRSTLIWRVEEQTAQVSIGMMCPPQLTGQ